jgi:hypothetical protein
MLNPSTADSKADEQTIRKCVGFKRKWECGRIQVVNPFDKTKAETLTFAHEPLTFALRRSLIVVATLIAVVVVIVWARSNSALSATERRVAGSWMLGSSGIYTFTADRHFLVHLVDSKGVAKFFSQPCDWSVQDEFLVLRSTRYDEWRAIRDEWPRSISHLFFGPTTTKWHIVSLTDDTLIIDGGTGAKPRVWKRLPTTLGSMQ